jgi:erythronate-4-phosphate dehydrogenase
MKIIVDENMPFGREAFGQLGDVITMPGRKITREAVRHAEALAIRSVTKVNAELLEGTAVRFVGTATIGVDHVDRVYLERRGIGFASAPGSNANSVAEYVMTALLVLGHRKGFRLEGATLGVVGVGNVGSRVARKAEALGMRVLRNDPPLARATGDPRFAPIERVLDESDVITFHVPLTRSGEDATFHMIDEGLLARMRPGAILFNTSRGAVAKDGALLRAASIGRLGGLVLDVFEREPNIDAQLVEAADLATPHIAGYSYDGKVNGTEMIYRAACAFFNQTVSWEPRGLLPVPPFPRLDVGLGADEDLLCEIVVTVYDIESDALALREITSLPEAERGAYFDQLRKTYPIRQEFPNTVIDAPFASEQLRAKIQGLGFRTA